MRVSCDTSTPDKPNVADLLAGQLVVLRLQLAAALPDDVAERGDGVRRGVRRHDQFARQLDLVTRPAPGSTRREAGRDPGD